MHGRLYLPLTACSLEHAHPTIFNFISHQIVNNGSRIVFQWRALHSGD